MTNIINILATPKEFKGKIAQIQKRAVANWLSLGDNVNVTVISDDGGKFLPVGDPRLRILPATERMRNGHAPEFTEVLDMACYRDDDYVLYCNADVLFTVGLLNTVDDLVTRNWVLCGRRVDLRENIVPPVDAVELDGWLQPAMRRGDAVLHDYCGIDYFGTQRKTWHGFGTAFIGRAGIDGALLAFLMRRRHPFIDCTGRFWAVHQWHDYDHISGGVQRVHKGDEAAHNLKAHKVRYGPPTLLDADFFYQNGKWHSGVERRSRNRTIERFLRFRLGMSWTGFGFAALGKLFMLAR